MTVRWVVWAIVALLTGLAGPGFAQTPGAAEFCVGLRDDGCDERGCRDSLAGCASKVFTPPVDEMYVLRVGTVCADGFACADRHACLSIYQGSEFIIECRTLGCPYGDCREWAMVHLQGGVEYTAFVCLAPCGDRRCGDAGDPCYAVGSVALGRSACPEP